MIDRRGFLKGSLAAAGSVALGGASVPDLTFSRARPLRPSADRLLALAAADAPIDTVVVVVLENRSFDHLLGWLARDQDYLEEGRRRHGKDFHVVGSNHERYRASDGTVHRTGNVFDLGGSDPLRGCGFRNPGHTWDNGRAERDGGFLAKGSGNDDFAISYFDGTVFPAHRVLAEHFTVLDRYHASLLAGTFPNRQYLHSAQSDGRKEDPGPLRTGIYHAETIWDRLAAARVPATYYYTDVPVLRLWGTRMKPYIAPLDRYFEQAAGGTLPNVSMLDPSFTGDLRADAHPTGNIAIALEFVVHVISALVGSPQWSSSALVLTYDEWGGFYDHVAPPRLPDARASSNDADDFGQAGFRVPAAVISPFAPKYSVDHTLYDHTSIMRFLEWRFLGAPASGPRSSPAGGKWWLTKRDRHAHPIGQSLLATPQTLDVPDVLSSPAPLPGATPACGVDPEQSEADVFAVDPSFAAEIAREHPAATHRPWEPAAPSAS